MPALLEVAASQLGYHEGPDPAGNWNNDNAYGEWYGMNRFAWCGVFVAWCAAHAGIPTNVIPKYAYTPSGAAWFASGGQLSQDDPQPGDDGFVYYHSLGRITHTFIVERDLGGGRIHTLEGNTNTSGSSQGDGVYRLHRVDNTALFYGRPVYLPAGEGGDHDPLDPPEEDDMTPDQAKQLADVATAVAKMTGAASGDTVLSVFLAPGEAKTLHVNPRNTTTHTPARCSSPPRGATTTPSPRPCHKRQAVREAGGPPTRARAARSACGLTAPSGTSTCHLEAPPPASPRRCAKASARSGSPTTTPSATTPP